MRQRETHEGEKNVTILAVALAKFEPECVPDCVTDSLTKKRSRQTMSKANTVEVIHPLIQHHLSCLRDVSTGPVEFRHSVHRLASLLAYEATKNLEVRSTWVRTPMATLEGKCLAQRIGLIPILRAGLGMVDPILELIPVAEVWHLGLYRDEKTARPVKYYSKLPPGRPVDTALIVDPMLATGGSAISAMETLKEWGVKSIKLLSIIAAPEGIEEISNAFPSAQVFVCAIDEKLNDQKFIVPGLGDAGDRMFNTIERGL
ncbi:MAG: uracil phosphoribosyltransferase [Pirellulaceae bacterium]|jgi:uracil phosphoribosyltransferase